MSVDIGFDFRATAGYVTDPANCTYERGTGLDFYPVTRGGYTFGWDPTGLSFVMAPVDRTTGQDARLAGINFYSAGPQPIFQLDLPNTGTFDISLAIGDFAGGTGLTTVDIYDTTTLLWSVTQVSTTANSFTDAQGNEYTAANWPTSNQPRAAVCATTALRFKVGTSPAFQGLAFFGVLEQVVPSQPWLYRPHTRIL